MTEDPRARASNLLMSEETFGVDFVLVTGFIGVINLKFTHF